MGNEVMLLVVAGVFLVFIVPVFAISAFVRVRKLESRKSGSADLEGRIALLTQRVYEVENKLAALETRPAPAAARPPGVAPVPMSTPPQVPRPAAEAPVLPAALIGASADAAAPPQPPRGRSSGMERPITPAGRAGGLDFESQVAGRWLNNVGILALVFAVAFFIKYAFDNNWVGPRGRVAIGLLIGASVLLWSGRLLGRGYQYFSEGIAGLGATVLYVSLWSAWHYYKIFTQFTAFVGMIFVTGVVSIIAVGRNSQRIAVCALAGGFLTPMLVSTGKDQEVVLFTYVAVLAAGMLVLERARQWPWLAPLSFLATQIYFWGWYSEFYRDEKLLLTWFYATLFFVLFAALPVMRSRREGRLSGLEVLVVLANAFCYLLALHQMLWPNHRWAMTVAVLALAAAHLGIVRAVPAREGQSPVVRLLFAGLALTFVTLAVPIRLDGEWISVAWAIEGAVLIWSGVRARTWVMRVAGLSLLAAIAVRLLVFDIPAPHFLLNERFLTFAVAVACFALSCYFVRDIVAELNAGERAAFAALAMAINIYALIALSQEFWDVFGRMQELGIERGLAQQLALSILWTLYATGLIVAGIVRKSAMLRWQALALFGLVAGKVFLFDLSFLSRFYRILSFLVLGLLLLLVSFLYQRKIAAQKAGE